MSHPVEGVLLVIESPGYGGTEIYVDRLYQYLSAHLSVHIVSLSGDNSAIQERFPDSVTSVVQGVAGLTALLKEIGARPLVVNLHLYSSLFPAMLALRCLGIPAVVTLHMPLSPWNFLHKIRWIAAVAMSTACIGVSKEALSGYGPALYGKQRSIAAAPLPLDTMPTARVSQPERRQLFTVAYVGRLSREKGLSTLIGAIAKVEGAQLVMIGDGPQRDELEQLAKENQVTVDFSGHLPQQELFYRLLAVDAFVLPSRFEGLGLAAIEAMALGVPVVCSSFPAASEYVIDEETGMLFPFGDVDCLARKLMRLRDDRELCETLGQSGAKFVREKFSAEVQFASYLKIFCAREQSKSKVNATN